MKPLGYYALPFFATTASGAFGFLDMRPSARREAVWSDEDFAWVTFPARLNSATNSTN